MGGLKHVGVAVWCAGIVACIALSVWSGLDDIGNALATVARGCWAWCFTRAATVAIAGAGWWLLFPVVRPLRLRTAVLLRFVREGINALLPLTQVGGDISWQSISQNCRNCSSGLQLGATSRKPLLSTNRHRARGRRGRTEDRLQGN